MTFKERLKNLLSRKFLLAVVAAAAGIAVALGADNALVQAIASAASAIIVVIYILMETKLDAAALASAVSAAAEALAGAITTAKDVNDTGTNDNEENQEEK